MKKIKEIELINLPMIIGIMILLLNDHFLKDQFHNTFTGKLSDFAGLFSISIFFGLLFPKHKKSIFILIALFFIYWKSSFSDGLIDLWNLTFNFQIGRVIDFTDLIALSILPIAFYVKSYNHILLSPLLKKGLSYVVFSLALFSFVATAGTHGKIESYQFSHSKNEVNSAIKIFFNQNPEYKVPEKYKNYAWHYGPRDSENKWIQAMNADTVSFHFYIKDEEGIFWTGFSAGQDNWNDDNCKLSVITYDELATGKTIAMKDITEEELEKVSSLFNREIVSKLKIILTNEN